MTEQELVRSVARLYWLAGIFTVVGFAWYVSAGDARVAFGFLLGALASFGNLALFVWLSRAISPGAFARTVWPTALYTLRFLALFLFGYVIVKLLGIKPLAVVLGLLVSAASVLTFLAAEIIQTLLRKQTTR